MHNHHCHYRDSANTTIKPVPHANGNELSSQLFNLGQKRVLDGLNLKAPKRYLAIPTPQKA